MARLSPAVRWPFGKELKARQISSVPPLHSKASFRVQDFFRIRKTFGNSPFFPFTLARP